MESEIINNLDLSELKDKFLDMWETVRATIMKIWNKVKEVFYRFIKNLPCIDKEYGRLLYYEKKVKSKRLKKKYRNKLVNYVTKTYLIQ